MDLVVATNQGLFPVSYIQLMSRNWEGAEPDSKPKLANGNIPYHRHHVQSMSLGWLGGWNFSFLLM